MIVIREKVQGRRKYFERMISNESSTISEKHTVEYRLTKVSKDGQDYFVLYDDDMKPVSPFFQYINIEMGHLAYNTREQAAHAIRQFYCFLELTKTDMKNLKKKDIVNLQFFLLGYSPSKGSYSFQLYTMRRNCTVNDYISIYRGYLRFLGIKCAYLSKERTIEIQSQSTFGESVMQKKHIYDSSLKTGTPVWRVPQYISVEEFSRIIQIVRKDKNTTAEVIVRLMFEYGLRIGEVLGITNEDVTEKRVDGELRPVIYIRNRASDNKKFQSAKTKLKVGSADVYRSPNYKQEKLGYDLIYLTEDFYDFVCEYIETVLSEAKRRKRIDKSEADTVGRGAHMPENHYIFLNSVFSPMSSKSWNEYLKTVYERAGIQIDKETRKNNLNHRFRHGFAMFQVKYRKTNLFELKEMMRHASVSSTMIYFKPTETDEYVMKTEFVEELYNLIPALKEKPVLYAER